MLYLALLVFFMLLVVCIAYVNDNNKLYDKEEERYR